MIVVAIFGVSELNQCWSLTDYTLIPCLGVGLLGAVPYLFSACSPLPATRQLGIRTAHVLVYILAGHVQQHVQPLRVLLDELEVRSSSAAIRLGQPSDHSFREGALHTLSHCILCGNRFRQGFKNIFCCTCLRTNEPHMFEKPRYHGAARYSCASEACITDMRVRFNGNGNITLQATTTASDIGTTGSSGTSPMPSKFTFSREML